MNSKIYISLISFFVALILAGCATVSVNQDYDPGYDFPKLKTFGFIPIPEDAGIDQLSAKRLGDAIIKELTA